MFICLLSNLLHIVRHSVFPHAEDKNFLLKLGDGSVLVANGSLQLRDLRAALAEDVLVVLLHPSDSHHNLLLPVPPDLLESDLDICLLDLGDAPRAEPQQQDLLLLFLGDARFGSFSRHFAVLKILKKHAR